MKTFAVVFATAGGAGYAPVAPGTFGSLVGLVIYLATRHSPLAWQLGLLAAIIVIGTWAATAAERHFGQEDPGPVVIDEVAGQLGTLILTGVGVTGAIVGFALFRVLDVVKPPPVDRLERLPRGYGIMGDDLMAGLYGNLLLQAAIRIFPGVL
jgi:phosphatidylglycerophosphatase A